MTATSSVYLGIIKNQSYVKRIDTQRKISNP